MLKDVQKTHDGRGISLQRVGVKKVHLPLQILSKDANFQHVMGNISICADLSHKYRGTHMSRFMEILNHWSKKEISSIHIKSILQEVKEKIDAESAQLSIEFKYFIEKCAPVSKINGFLDYDCLFYGILENNSFSFILGVKVPVQLVCPCSKEISREGAHNQRATVRVNLEYLKDNFIWIEDVVSGIESCASSPVYPVLKREDEKYVTESSFANPRFVEDIVRELVEKFREDNRIRWFEIECDSYESIHNHNAFAYQEEMRQIPGDDENLLPIPDMHF